MIHEIRAKPILRKHAKSDPATYTDRNIHDPALIGLADKVRIDPIPEMEMKIADVTVRMRDGAFYQAHFDVGVPERNLDRQWESLTTKFSACASTVLPPDKIKGVIAAVGDLDKARDVSSLVEAWS